jgi:hypothetical protein
MQNIIAMFSPLGPIMFLPCLIYPECERKTLRGAMTTTTVDPLETRRQLRCVQHS